MRKLYADTAMGKDKADLVIKGGRLVNVITGEIYPADLAVKGDTIVYVGNVEHTVGEHTEVIDAQGRFLVPGLIDQHVHTYESQMSVVEYAAAVLPRGVTSIVTDFYGECVVGGMKAVRESIDIAQRETPLKILFVLPMPAFYQNKPFEHTGHPDLNEMLEMMDWEECVGTNDTFGAKMIAGDPDMQVIIDEAQKRNLHVCGHGSELNEMESNAWMAYVGRTDDHECGNKDEVIYKARLGMYISMRIGSGCVDLPNLCRALAETKMDTRRFTFNTDTIAPIRIIEQGHLDSCVREAIKCGVSPVEAIRMATINTAECVRVDEKLGSITPGKIADILLVRDLIDFDVETVIASGKRIADNGALVKPFKHVRYPDYAYNTVYLGRKLEAKDFQIKATKPSHKVRVIECRTTGIITFEDQMELEAKDGLLEADSSTGLQKVASIDRIRKTGDMFCGFVKGFGLKRGAIASTFNPHNQNMMIVGTNDEDMAVAANALADCGGGFIIVDGGKEIAKLELPLFGLLSDKNLEEVVEKFRRLYAAAKDIGCILPEPFHNIAFMGLPVIIGNMKITPKGLVDVWKEAYIDLIIE